MQHTELLGIQEVDVYAMLWLKCCFTFTETIGLLGTGAQDGHLDFHTVLRVCMRCCTLESDHCTVQSFKQDAHSKLCAGVGLSHLLLSSRGNVHESDHNIHSPVSETECSLVALFCVRRLDVLHYAGLCDVASCTHTHTHTHTHACIHARACEHTHACTHPYTQT